MERITNRKERIKLEKLSEVEMIVMKVIWKLGNEITMYDVIDYLKEHYNRDYTRSTLKTYVTKLKKKGFITTNVKGNYSYITAVISEEAYRREQMELMKDFWYDGSAKQLFQTLTNTISEDEMEELKEYINDLDD